MDARAAAQAATPRTKKGRQTGRRIPLPSLHLALSERRLLLAAVDLALLNLALGLVVALRMEEFAALYDLTERAVWFVTLSTLWLLVGAWLNIYSLPRAANVVDSPLTAGTAALITGGVYLLVPRVTPPLPTHRAEAFLLPLAAALGVAAWRLVYASVFVQPGFQRRIIILGAGWAGRVLMQAIREVGNGAADLNRATGYMVLGFVDDDVSIAGKVVEGAPVLGTRADLRRLVRELHPDELVLAITNVGSLSGDFFQAILDCRESGLQLTTMANLYERITGRVPVQHAGRDLNVVIPLDRPAAHRLYMSLRRAVDITAGVLGCLLVALLCLPLWIANRLTSPGPLLYWQDRVGMGGKIFSLVKFRSMCTDAEKESGAVWAAADDQRVTRLGRFLRRTRLDEFPQFWNVLKGDMALIGPRPERPEFVGRLSREIPFYRLRHAVKPGITGWAQVRHGYAASSQDSLVKLQYDLYYIKHKGPYLDILILMRTGGVMLGLKGR